jgi:HEAT repeats
MDPLTENPTSDGQPLDGPPDELPTVEPPTAGFIIQLFVIPAVIVAVVIVVWLLFGKLAGGERDAMDYVRTIRSDNENRRWRAAHELASLIGNDERLAHDPVLLGELTDLLSQELGKDGNPELRVYLAVALGVFQTLDGRSESGRPVDPLATLSRALDRKEPVKVRMAAAESLAKQAARLDGSLDDPSAVRALVEASDDPEPELRKRATYALGFFGGSKVDDALRKRLDDEDREVRYNAAIALGRRGDPAALPIFREVLNPGDLSQVIRSGNEDEKKNQVESIELVALQSLQTAVGRGIPSLAQLLRPQVAKLATSNLASVRMEAEALLKSLPPLRTPTEGTVPSFPPADPSINSP